MVYCIKCGAEQSESTKYCTKCGTKITSSNESNMNNKKGTFEERIEKKAEVFGKKAEKVGSRIEKKADDFGKHINHWYDQTFGILGPLVGAFIALIVLRIIIYFIQVSGENIFIFSALSDGLYQYLLLIFASILISNYNTYLNRRYKHKYLFIYPFIGAIGFIIGFWVLAQIMLIISQQHDTPIIQAIGEFINSYIIVFFALAIIIGYIAQVTSNSNNKN